MMKHLIIGTAGHVDHGKTALIRALTGVDTDRLKEEKERGISIELGFTVLELPSGRQAGIVDVPGHERFIKHMLAGAGGFDLVLLVIAADEGVMPQTKEHLDIMRLLQVENGVVVLTKIDLVDEEWLELVREDVQNALKGTALEEAPLVQVSAVTGQGLDDLLHLLDRVAEETPTKAGPGSLRLPVDRVFSITGFGTVVTGTLLSGEIRVGEAVEVQPQGLSSRVRSLQSHGQKVELVEAGQRVAVNLAGLEVEQIKRGSVVAAMHSLIPSQRLDVRLSLLENALRPLKNRAPIRFYLGSGETLGRVVLLDREELEPGAAAYAQLHLEEAVAAIKGDRFVLRSYSPMLTIGGGVIIDPLPVRKYKRFRSEVLKSLETREKGTPAEVLEQYLQHNPDLAVLTEAADKIGLPPAEMKILVQQLSEQKKIRVVPGDGKEYLLLMSVYLRLAAELEQMLEAYHRDFPLREGHPKEELRSRKFAAWSHKTFQFLLTALESDQIISCTPQAVAVPTFVPGSSPEISSIIIQIRDELTAAGYQPSAWSELTAVAGLPDHISTELLQHFLRNGELVKIGENLYFLEQILALVRQQVIEFLHREGNITVRDLRDLLQTSRKYALPLLEHFDKERITQRVGDKRIPGKAYPG